MAGVVLVFEEQAFHEGFQQLAKADISLAVGLKFGKELLQLKQPQGASPESLPLSQTYL